MNAAPGLPLTIGLIGELVEKKELECKVAVRGSKGLLWIPLPRGGMPNNRFPGIFCG